MKSLIVYYSLDGHTRRIAEMIAKETASDIHELKTCKPSTGKSGFTRYFLGGMRVNTNQKPALSAPLPSLNDYELIFIGTPIWASSFVPAVNSFISGCDLTGKNIMLFSSSVGGDGSKCYAKLKSRLPGASFLGELSLKESSFNNMDDVAAKVKAWVTGINN